MVCQYDEQPIINDLYSTDPVIRMNAINSALELHIDSIAMGVAVKDVIARESDGYLGPAIISGALQIAGNVGAAHGGMNEYLLGIISNPPVISYTVEEVVCIGPEYLPTPSTSTVALDSVDNMASIKAAAVGGLETINEATVLPEEEVDAVIGDLELVVDAVPEDDMFKVDGLATATMKLCGRVSKKVNKERRNKMATKLRTKFYAKQKKKLSCGPATSMGDIIKDQGSDAPPLDPTNPNEEVIIEIMGNCGDTISDPTVSISCPGGRVRVGDTVDFAPTVTNSKAEIVIVSGVISVDDISGISVSVDFGDGAAGSVYNFSHAYAAPGEYATIISVTDLSSGLVGTSVCHVSVYYPIQVSVDPPIGPPVVETGSYVDVPVHTDGDVIVYSPSLVDQPDGVPVSAPGGIVTVIVPSPPDQIVLTFIDPYGYPAEPPVIVVPIDIAALPLSAAISTDDVACEGVEKVISLDVAGAVSDISVVWVTNGAEQSGPIVLSVSYSAGSYGVFAIVSELDGRQVTTDTIVFEIFPRYDAYISSTSVPGGDGIVPGLTINFDVCVTLCDGSPISDKPEIVTTGTPVGDDPYTRVYPAPGTYPVDAKIKVDGSPDIEISEQVIVYGPPIITFSHSMSPVCPGLATFSIGVTGGKPPYSAIYLDAGDGRVYAVENNGSTEHQYVASGMYLPSVTVMDADDIVSVQRSMVEVA